MLCRCPQLYILLLCSVGNVWSTRPSQREGVRLRSRVVGRNTSGTPTPHKCEKCNNLQFLWLKSATYAFARDAYQYYETALVYTNMDALFTYPTIVASSAISALGAAPTSLNVQRAVRILSAASTLLMSLGYLLEPRAKAQRFDQASVRANEFAMNGIVLMSARNEIQIAGDRIRTLTQTAKELRRRLPIPTGKGILAGLNREIKQKENIRKVLNRLQGLEANKRKNKSSMLLLRSANCTLDKNPQNAEPLSDKFKRYGLVYQSTAARYESWHIGLTMSSVLATSIVGVLSVFTLGPWVEQGATILLGAIAAAAVSADQYMRNTEFKASATTSAEKWQRASELAVFIERKKSVGFCPSETETQEFLNSLNEASQSARIMPTEDVVAVEKLVSTIQEKKRRADAKA